MKLIPSDTEIGTKTFTVTNNGDDTSYVVVIENVSITKDGITTTFESNDFRYTLSCIKKDGTSCDGVSTQSVFPINGGVLVGNSISKDVVHTYTFKMWYLDTGIDQSNDMGKSLQARLNIANLLSMTNLYSTNTNSLSYNIIENAKNKINGTELLSSPRSRVAEKIAKTKGNKIANEDYGFYGWDGLTYGDTQDEADGGTNTVSGADNVAKCNSVKGKHISDASSCYYDCSYIGKVEDCTTDGTPIIGIYTDPENTMSIATDDYGTSYYYRGNVIDNYVNFAGMCWRAVRIAGDGSIKLILED